MTSNSTAYVCRCHELSQYAFNEAQRQYGDKVLMATVHGSWLYGTAHEHSDTDLYVVVDDVRTKQRVDAHGLDVMRINTAAYFEQLDCGAHQAAEAHYSPYRRCGVWRRRPRPCRHVVSHTNTQRRHAVNSITHMAR